MTLPRGSAGQTCCEIRSAAAGSAGGLTGNLPVLGELRLQVLSSGVEELDEVRGVRDPRVAAQELVAVFLQELEAHQRAGGALLLAAALQFLVWMNGETT